MEDIQLWYGYLGCTSVKPGFLMFFLPVCICMHLLNKHGFDIDVVFSHGTGEFAEPADALCFGHHRRHHAPARGSPREPTGTPTI